MKRTVFFILLLIFVISSKVQAKDGPSMSVTPSDTAVEENIDPSVQALMKQHFTKGMEAFSLDSFGVAINELKAATAVKTKFPWQTWYVSAYKTLGVIYEFHSNDPDHKTLAYLYYSLAAERDPHSVTEKQYMRGIPASERSADEMAASQKETTAASTSDDFMLEPETQPHWKPAPQPKADSRNLDFDIYSVYENAAAGAQLFSLADLNAWRKLDENSTTADLQVRFSKSLSSSDSAGTVDLRIARITYVEPWLQVSVGRLDVFPVFTPMNFFGSYLDMGIHRVDGVMATIPIFFEFGAKNGPSYSSLPTSLSVFYTPSLLEASNVTLDTQQSFLLAQARAKFTIGGLESSWAFNAAFTDTDYFTYSSLNGGTALSATGEITIDDEFSLYGELGDQNTALLNSTDVLGVGLKVQKIRTWGAVSMDELCVELQEPLGNDPNNAFSGGNPFNPAQAGNTQASWYADTKFRIHAITFTFAVTNNMDDFTLNRLNSSNSAFPNYPVGPGRELEKSQIPLVAASYLQPAFLGSISIDF